MKKQLEIVLKNLPEKKAVFADERENYLIYLGEDYGKKVSKNKACGLFLGSKDSKIGDVDIYPILGMGATLRDLFLEHSKDIVLFLDTPGFYLMERAVAHELLGEMDSV